MFYLKTVLKVFGMFAEKHVRQSSTFAKFQASVIAVIAMFYGLLFKTLTMDTSVLGNFWYLFSA